VTGPRTPVTLRGAPVELAGDTLKVGDPAPDATLVDPMGTDVTISSMRGKVLVLSVVPELDTTVCSSQTVRFNRMARDYGEDVKFLSVSVDSPHEVDRWCEQMEVDSVYGLSDAAKKDFGRSYGVLMPASGKLTRAVFVIDRGGVIRHVEVVGELTREPLYEPVEQVVRKLQAG